ncbi:MAG: hypothetical protein AMJ89_07000 [candidate division Zixibacteria bacterium SM23_73]|nr:MAG: hypothetical protein AMJ89_07000 [candidate division Zixibacteria bacterium SM23_73]
MSREILLWGERFNRQKTPLNTNYKSVVWDGNNDSGKDVASGIYFYRIEVGNFSETKKLVFLNSLFGWRQAPPLRDYKKGQPHLVPDSVLRQ